ncbi:MAG TPA: TolC family protein [bacterium]
MPTRIVTRTWQGPAAALLALLWVAMSPGPVRAADPGPPETPVALETLLEEARARNPRIRAAQAAWRAARLDIPQASALPDPTVGYMVMGEHLETRLGPQEHVFEVEQMVPFPGKLLARRREAAAAARAAEAAVRGIEQDVRLSVAQAYYDLYAVDGTIRVVEDLQELLRNIEGIAQARYASGTGSQRDVAKAQAEVSDTIQRLFVLRQRRETLGSLLNALLDRDPRGAAPSTVRPDVPSAALELDTLLELARTHRPELAAAAANAEEAAHAAARAKLAYAPDLSVGFRYIGIGDGTTSLPHDGRDAWMVPVMVTVPLWQNRIVPEVLEAARRREASRALLEEETNLTEFAVRDAFARFDAARRIVSLYEHALIPEAELALRSDQAGYEAGRTDVLNLIDSERVYLNANVAHLQSLAEALTQFAALERAVGAPLDGAAAPRQAGQGGTE